jgi:hypothetical protein
MAALLAPAGCQWRRQKVQHSIFSSFPLAEWIFLINFAADMKEYTTENK